MTLTHLPQSRLVGETLLAAEYSEFSCWPKIESSKVFILEAVDIVGRFQYRELWSGQELNSFIWREAPLPCCQAYWSAKIAALEKTNYADVKISYVSNERECCFQPSQIDFEEKKSRELAELHGLLKKPPQSIIDAQGDWEENQIKINRLSDVAYWIGQRARDAQIDGFYQCDNEPEIYSLEPKHWSCADDLTCWLANVGTNIRHYSSPDCEPKVVRALFFVSRASLEKALSRDSIPPLSPSLGLNHLHLSPYIRLMLHVIEAEGVTAEYQSSVAQLEAALKESASRFGIEVSDTDLSNRLLKAMPTLIREPSSKKGGAHRKG